MTPRRRHDASTRSSTFTKQDVDEYERAYRVPGGLRGMLGYYRAVIEDMRQNERLSVRKLQVPILALGGDNGSAPTICEAMRGLGDRVSGGQILDCGHYIPEERPEALVSEILAFAAVL